jgi:hypothetical protein
MTSTQLFATPSLPEQRMTIFSRSPNVLHFVITGDVDFYIELVK